MTYLSIILAIFGTVFCDGAPKAGVAVSDGVNITTTDKKGNYRLQSEKKEGSVFVIIPSGTQVNHDCGMPAFWQRLQKGPQEDERCDFQLTSVNNDKHIILAISDIHLANLNNDFNQFRGPFMTRFNEEVEKYRSQGLPVYCINGGDSSYDRYWYEYHYSIADFPGTLRKVNFPVPMFSVMGNHDNDPAVSPANGLTPEETDFMAAEAYRKAMGPTRYSLNIGKVHYIFLDNIVYLNSEGRIDSYEGVAGKRNYDIYITPDALKWLEKDLALIKDKSTPVVVTMHSPVLSHKGGQNATPIITRFKSTSAVYSQPKSPEQLLGEFTTLFKDFPSVHFITGHTHKNLPCRGKDDTNAFPNISNITEHNITGVCGCWWYTASRGSLTLAPDGGPAGFETFTVDGTDLKWYFVSTDDGASKQMRVFDMNCVRDYYRTDGEVLAMLSHYPNRKDYGAIEDNVLLVQVWAWDSDWKIKVVENGKELEAKALKAENPQMTVDYYIPKAAWEDNGTNRWSAKYDESVKSPHFFRIKAAEAKSTVTITVTDSFGTEYTEVVQRPKAFGRLMR